MAFSQRIKGGTFLQYLARTGLAQMTGPTARKGVLAIAGQGFASGTNFLTGVIIGRACTKEEFGLYVLGFTILVFVLELQNAMITTPYMVYAPRLESEGHKRYTGSTLIHQGALTAFVIFGLATGVFASRHSANFGHLHAVLWTLAGVMLFIMLRDYVRRVCFANLEMFSALVIDAVVSIIQIAGLFLLARAGLLTAVRAYLVIGAACGVISIGWLLVRADMFSMSFKCAAADFGKNWMFGKWVVASALLWSFSMNFYPWLLSYFKDEAAVGVFGACWAVVNLGNMILMGAQNFLGPKIASIYAESGLTRIYVFLTKACLVLGVPLAAFSVAMLFGGEWIVTLVYGGKYAGTGAIVFVLSVNLFALALSFPFGRALFAIERADMDFYINFVSLGVLLVFGIWMTRGYGPLGAALGLMAANISSCAVRFAAFLLLAGRAKERAEA